MNKDVTPSFDDNNRSGAFADKMINLTNDKPVSINIQPAPEVTGGNVMNQPRGSTNINAQMMRNSTRGNSRGRK